VWKRLKFVAKKNVIFHMSYSDSKINSLFMRYSDEFRDFCGSGGAIALHNFSPPQYWLWWKQRSARCDD
jgi:hypothetical protein